MKIRLICFATLWFVCVSHAAGKHPDASAVTTQHPLATQAGMDMLRRGGNAFDATVAIMSTLAVVEPYNSGLGGGGFWLFHDAEKNQTLFLDARETAPLLFKRSFVLNDEGKIDEKIRTESVTTAGIPGTPAAMVYLSKMGEFTLNTQLAKAIHYAEKGFYVDDPYVRKAKLAHDKLKHFASSADIYLVDGEVPSTRTLITQHDLANTLKNIAVHGEKAFYDGQFAKNMVESVNAAGGHWQVTDLKRYEVRLFKPLVTQYHDSTLITAPLPSAGGHWLASVFNILENFDLKKEDKNQQRHLVLESMKRASWDKLDFVGEQQYPSDLLLDKRYAKRMSLTIQDTALSTKKLNAAYQPDTPSYHTSAFLVLDEKGNWVAATTSVNYFFGSGFVVPGTGVLLNNTLSDFNYNDPASPNAPAPGRRPLSHMTPTALTNKNMLALFSSPGGDRIPSIIAIGLLEALNNQEVLSWPKKPRYHLKFDENIVEYEPDAFDIMEKIVLTSKGHEFKEFERSWDKEPNTFGNLQVVAWLKDKNNVLAASDPRQIGEALVEHTLPPEN